MVNDELREQIKDYIGINSNNLFTGFKSINEEQCDGYIRTLIQYSGSENDVIPAYLLIPEGEGAQHTEVTAKEVRTGTG